MGEIEKLRRWSAEKVARWTYHETTEGYYFSFGAYVSTCGKVMHVYSIPDKHSPDGKRLKNADDWRPDDPTTGQIWLFVERIRQMGFNFNLNWQQLPEITMAIAQFHKISGNLEHGQGADDNPCLAILKAGYEAVEEGVIDYD